MRSQRRSPIQTATIFCSLAHILLYLTVCVFIVIPSSEAKTIVVASPDRNITAMMSDDGGTLTYTVTHAGKPILAPSRVAITSDGMIYGLNAVLGIPTMSEVNERYRFFGGKTQAVNEARIATIPLTTSGKTYMLDVHVANDGVGVRLRLPEKTGRRVDGDGSTWRLNGNPIVWAAHYDPGYEQSYKTTTLKNMDLKPYALPLTARIGDVYVTFSEAALLNYSDMAVRRSNHNQLVGFLPAEFKGWSTDAEVVQPWRVTIVARDLNALVNTTLVQNLNPAADPALATADWINPGRSAWQWMAVGAPEFADQHQWVDRTKALGYEYYLVDEGWSEWKDAWASLKSVVDYASTVGIKIWLWAHSREVADAAVRVAYLRRAAEIGIVGVKIDFPEPANHWWSTWYYDTARDAARYKLLVDFHGAVKPTGMERTWPNEITREAIRGHEYHITRYNRRSSPDHDTILPFTRYIIGHGDYTPMVFNRKELQGNSWAHEMAQSIIFTSPFLCFGGDPANYISNPARDVIMALPATWDETIVLRGSEPGKIVGFARRHNDEWFVGVINGERAATMPIKLNFLIKGRWRMTRLGDVAGDLAAWDRRELEVAPGSEVLATMPARGGFVAWIRK